MWRTRWFSPALHDLVLPRISAVLTVVVLLVPAAPVLALELAREDVASLPEGELQSMERAGPDRLDMEYWIVLPEGTSFQAMGDRGGAAADKAVTRMTQGGWELIRENRQRRGGEFWFRKDVIKEAKLSVGTAGKPTEGKMRHHVFMRYELKRLIPTVDLKGLDIPDAPRYPGSTRVRWMNILGDFAAKYLVAAPIGEVRSYYERELPKLGWQPSRGAGTLNYTKGGVSSPDEMSPEDAQIDRPLEMIAKMIPSTLSIHLDDQDGIVHIGLGRSAGADDLEAWEDLPMTPVRDPSGDADSPRDLATFMEIDDLPVYEGLVQESRRREPMSTAGEEITTLLYRKQAPPSDAIRAGEFYLAEMGARGWTLLDEEAHGFSRKLVYRKGAIRVEIHVKAVGHENLRDSPRPIPIPVEVRVLLPIPTADIAGQDVDGVPRMPGSVRFYHLKAAMDHIVKFKTVASFDEAEWFFIDELPKAGWTFAGNDSTGLLFVPAGTAQTATQAFAEGQLVPTTLKVIVDDMRDGTVKIGTALTKGDT